MPPTRRVEMLNMGTSFFALRRARDCARRVSSLVAVGDERARLIMHESAIFLRHTRQRDLQEAEHEAVRIGPAIIMHGDLGKAFDRFKSEAETVGHWEPLVFALRLLEATGMRGACQARRAPGQTGWIATSRSKKNPFHAPASMSQTAIRLP